MQRILTRGVVPICECRHPCCNGSDWSVTTVVFVSGMCSGVGTRWECGCCALPWCGMAPASDMIEPYRSHRLPLFWHGMILQIVPSVELVQYQCIWFAAVLGGPKDCHVNCHQPLLFCRAADRTTIGRHGFPAIVSSVTSTYRMPTLPAATLARCLPMPFLPTFWSAPLHFSKRPFSSLMLARSSRISSSSLAISCSTHVRSCLHLEQLAVKLSDSHTVCCFTAALNYQKVLDQSRPLPNRTLNSSCAN